MSDDVGFYYQIVYIFANFSFELVRLQESGHVLIVEFGSIAYDIFLEGYYWCFKIVHSADIGVHQPY